MWDCLKRSLRKATSAVKTRFPAGMYVSVITDHPTWRAANMDHVILDVTGCLCQQQSQCLAFRSGF